MTAILVALLLLLGGQREVFEDGQLVELSVGPGHECRVSVWDSFVSEPGNIVIDCQLP